MLGETSHMPLGRQFDHFQSTNVSNVGFISAYRLYICHIKYLNDHINKTHIQLLKKETFVLT